MREKFLMIREKFLMELETSYLGPGEIKDYPWAIIVATKIIR